MENAYFEALGKTRSEKWTLVFSKLDSRLHSDLAIRLVASNREKLNSVDLERYIESPTKQASFIASLCTGLSSRKVFVLPAFRWKMFVYNVTFNQKLYSHEYILDSLSFDTSPEVNKALDDCAETRRNNQVFLDKHLESITRFICQNNDLSSGNCNKYYLQ